MLNHANRIQLLESKTHDGKSTDTSDQGVIAPSDHIVLIERFHACSWKLVPPHLRDPVRLLRSFIEINRARVEQAICTSLRYRTIPHHTDHIPGLAHHIPDLMDPKTLSQSHAFLLLCTFPLPP